MKTILLGVYIAVCFLIIIAVFLQNGKGSQMGAAFSPQTSKNLFGASGPKDFFYTSTKWLVVLFFSLAISLTILDTRLKNKEQERC